VDKVQPGQTSPGTSVYFRHCHSTSVQYSLSHTFSLNYSIITDVMWSTSWPIFWLTDKQTTWSRVLLEKLTIPQLVRNFLHTEHEVSLQDSQLLATCPYPEPDQSSPLPTNRVFLKTPFNIPLFIQVVSVLRVCPEKHLYAPFLYPRACHMPRPSHSSWNLTIDSVFE